MNPKQEIINKFERLIKVELEKAGDIEDKEEKKIKLDTLYKINKYVANFDELEPVLNKYFYDKKRREKWEER